MVTDSELARRLAVLEQEVAELKRRVGTSSGDWPERVFGRMKDFPEFDEVHCTGSHAIKRDSRLSDD